MTRTHFSDFPMSDAQRKIAQMGIDKNIRRIKNAEEQLGYCPKCDHEYTEAQVEGIDFDRALSPWVSECPKCHTSEQRILYYCPDCKADNHDGKRCRT